MSHSAAVVNHLPGVADPPGAGQAAIPWYAWCSLLAVTSAMIGVHWDISWHRSIGRDTFFTPAHIAIYLCGVLAGVSCGYLILTTTFHRTSGLRQATVRMWGFRGPLGAFLAAWGGVAMLTSAPFDDWWHNAYGLDVKIISPPHMVLAAGMFSVMLGSLLLMLGLRNRAEAARRRALSHAYIYVAGMVVVTALTINMEQMGRVLQHSSLFYRSVALVVPVFLVSCARAADVRFAATRIAAVYTAFWLLVNWALPLFPAEPKLGPVYFPVKNFVPSHFPILLLAPAFAVDLLLQRTESWRRWLRGMAAGALFFATFVAVQWPMASFLMTPASRNWFFFTNQFDYATRPTSAAMRHVFVNLDPTPAAFWQGMALALAISLITAWVGLVWGEWMRRLRR